MTLHYIYDMLRNQMALLRPGRKRVTTSFTIKPELHDWLKETYPEHGLRSRVLEQLVKKLKEGKIGGLILNEV